MYKARDHSKTKIGIEYSRQAQNENRSVMNIKYSRLVFLLINFSLQSMDSRQPFTAPKPLDRGDSFVGLPKDLKSRDIASKSGPVPHVVNHRVSTDSFNLSSVVDSSYFAPNTKMKDYLGVLKSAKFDKVKDDALLTKYINMILQEQKSGQAVYSWWSGSSKNPTMSPEQVANENVFIGDTYSAELKELHAQIEKIQREQSKEISLLEQIATAPVNGLNAAQNAAGNLVASAVQAVAHHPIVKKAVNRAIASGAESVIKGSTNQSSTQPYLDATTQTALRNAGLAIGANIVDAATGQLKEFQSTLSDTNAAKKTTPSAQEIRFGQAFKEVQGQLVETGKQLIEKHSDTLAASALEAAHDYLTTPAEGQSSSIFNSLGAKTTEQAGKLLAAMKDHLLRIAYPQAKQLRDAKQQPLEITNFLKPQDAEHQIINYQISSQDLRHLGVELNPTSQAVTTRIASERIKSNKLSEYLTSASYSTAKMARNNLKALRIFMQKLSNIIAVALAMTPREIDDMQAEIDTQEKLLIKDQSSWFYATDEEQFNNSFKKWIHKMLVELYKFRKKDYPGDLKVVTILQSEQQYPMPTVMTLTVNTRTNKVVSAVAKLSDGQIFKFVQTPDSSGQIQLTLQFQNNENRPSVLTQLTGGAINKYFLKKGDSLNILNADVDNKVSPPTISDSLANLVVDHMVTGPVDDAIILTLNPQSFIDRNSCAIEQKHIKRTSDGGIITTTKILKQSSADDTHQVTLESGTQPDRYLPTVKLALDASGNPTMVDIEHCLQITTNGKLNITPYKPQQQTIVYDKAKKIYKISAYFDVAKDEKKTLEYAYDQVLQSGVDAAVIMVKNLIAEAPALQDLRKADPNLAQILNIVQAEFVAAAPISIAKVEVEYDVKTKTSTVKTAQNFSDGTVRIVEHVY